MPKRNIIVIGASSGGFEALKQLIADLPKDLDASIFIVWHISPDVQGILPQVFNKLNSLHAGHAIDKEPIEAKRIYIAPPDRHLTLEPGYVCVSRGPKENRFRPAVDPLFRSAAYVYSNRVIGVILSGALDDGTAGLWAVKNRGGIAIVQDPADAVVPSMPESARREVAVDYTVPISKMAPLLARLSSEEVPETNHDDMEDNERTKIEISIAENADALEKNIMKFGTLTPYTCPECNGVLSSLKEGGYVRYRCHTGHAFSADSLLAALTENIEDSLWNAVRTVEESMMLLNHVGDHFAENNQLNVAAMYFKKAREAKERIQLVRDVVLSHEHLSMSAIQQQAAIGGNQNTAI